MADALSLVEGRAERLKRVSIVQEGYEGQIRMANLAIIGSLRSTGVSKLHSELVKTGWCPTLSTGGRKSSATRPTASRSGDGC